MGIQVSGLAWNDELCFKVMKLIEEDVKFEQNI